MVVRRNRSLFHRMSQTEFCHLVLRLLYENMSYLNGAEINFCSISNDRFKRGQSEEVYFVSTR